MKSKHKGAPNNQWQDHYTRRAKKEKYPARSVYKLEEIQQKFRILGKGDRVLDLGCAPGSWLLFAAKQTGSSGQVIGIDLQKLSIDLPPHAQAIQADVTDPETGWVELAGGKFDVVISDMAPATTGNKVVDTARSFDLCRAALDVALKVLKPGETWFAKFFKGRTLRFSNRMCASILKK